MGTPYNTRHLFSLFNAVLPRRLLFFCLGYYAIWAEQSLESKQSNPLQSLGPDGGLIWRPVANTKDQTFHLCIFLEHRHSLKVSVFRWSYIVMGLLLSRGCLSELGDKFEMLEYSCQQSHKRQTAAVQSLMFTLKSISTDMYKFISLSFNHETTNLEQYGYYDNICRVAQRRTGPSAEGWIATACVKWI